MHRRTITIIVLSLVALVGVATALGAFSGSPRRHVVTTAKDATLGKTLLVTLRGRTLYALSVERHGRFICTDKSCLSLWTPLVVAAHVVPTGAPSLGTVKRPDGRRQVTYKGGPLYTFSGDRARGDVKGEGLRDVGLWHAAAVGAGSAQPPTTTATTTGYGGYGY
jgi:predicted lipoprotein with Yx(FWY)xxD motif